MCKQVVKLILYKVYASITMVIIQQTQHILNKLQFFNSFKELWVRVNNKIAFYFNDIIIFMEYEFMIKNCLLKYLALCLHLTFILNIICLLSFVTQNF